MAVRETVTLDEVIEFMNELIRLDRPAVAALFSNRVPCNERLAAHETVQVRAQHGGYAVGMMGVLNGLFGIRDDGMGPLALVFDDQGPNRYRKLLRIDRTPESSGLGKEEV